MSISFSSVHALACGMLVMGSVAGGSACAQQFSGDMIRSSGPRTLDSSRVHVKGTKLRIENAAGGKDQYNILLNDGDRTLTAIDVAGHRYAVVPLVSPTTATQVPPALAMFHPGNGGNPCDYWNGVLKSMSSSVFGPEGPPTVACTSAGSDNVSGRAARKWAVTSNREPGTTSVWIDQGLGVVTRVQDNQGEMEFRNISEDSQPDTLFEVPSGFAKTDLAALATAQSSGKAVTSTSNGIVDGAGKTLGKDAAKIAGDAARQKADSSMAKKAKHIFHIP